MKKKLTVGILALAVLELAPCFSFIPAASTESENDYLKKCIFEELEKDFENDPYKDLIKNYNAKEYYNHTYNYYY
ncbi:hypothetical protein [Helcococcus bovis]|uniref:hypothetical protein n=1 Tax=Helcococcus bovis TaxID=3153252 RepID=UPI0038B9E64A